MNFKLFFQFAIFILLCALLINSQTTQVFAQGGCFDAAGGPIPCTETPEPEEASKTSTPVPITFTFTYTPTLTATNTFIPTATQTPTATNTATPTFTPTASITPTVTPIPVSQVVLPGAGIGALILFLIVGLLLPMIQKLRVVKRGY